MEKLFGMQDYMQLEGLALRIVPIKSRSETNIYGLLGSGRVNTETLYENVTTKWKWGNFDKEDTYVNHSYGPSVQSMQFSIQRGAQALLNEGKKEKAVNLVDQYFDAFPNMNFEYGIHAAYMIGIYSQAGAYDKAKPQMKILARNIEDRIDYYMTLPDDILQLSYGTDFQAALAVAERLVAYAQRGGDTEYQNELMSVFGDFIRPPQPTPELPGELAAPPPGE
jgi:tetratricopeptide (TPR) repeat protein